MVKYVNSNCLKKAMKLQKGYIDTKASKGTTLADYNIGDARIRGDVLTLGEDKIEFMDGVDPFNLVALAAIAASSGTLTLQDTENDYYKFAITDSEGKVLLGKQTDGTWYVGGRLDETLNALIEGTSVTS